jgi:YbbR domain-containing protein
MSAGVLRRFQRWLFDLVRRNFWLKLISLALATGLWFSVARQAVTEVEFSNVPVTFGNLPRDMEIVKISANSVSVRVRGLTNRVSQIDSSKLRARAADFLENVGEGETVLAVEPENINVPSGVEVLYINPSQIIVELERKKSKDVEVQPAFRNRPPRGYWFRGYRVQPARVTVEAPRSELQGIHYVVTEPIDLSGWTRDFTQNVTVGFNLPTVVIRGTQRVKVDVRIEPRRVDRLVRSLIRPEPPDLGAELDTDTALVLLRGPEQVLEGLEEGAITVVALIEDATPGEHVTRLVVTDLPQGCELLEIFPNMVEVRVPEREPAPTGTAGPPGGVSGEGTPTALPREGEE